MVDQRKARRFPIRLPVRVVRVGSEPFLGEGETRNLSSRGVLFVADSGMKVGECIEYIISLPASQSGEGSAELFCLGKVLRASESSSEPGSGRAYAVAATLERYEFLRLARQRDAADG